MKERIAQKKSQELVASTEAERKQHAPTPAQPTSAKQHPHPKPGSKKNKPQPQQQSQQPHQPAPGPSKEPPIDTGASSAGDANDNKGPPRSGKPKKAKKKAKQPLQPSGESKAPPSSSSASQKLPATQAASASIPSCGIQAVAPIAHHFAQTSPPGQIVVPAASTSGSEVDPEEAVDADVEDAPSDQISLSAAATSSRQMNPVHRRENTLTRNNVAALEWAAHKRQQSASSHQSPETAKLQQTPRQAHHWESSESSSTSSSAHSCGDSSSADGVLSPRSAATSLSSSAAQSNQMQSLSAHLPQKQWEKQPFPTSAAFSTDKRSRNGQSQSKQRSNGQSARQRTRSATGPSAYQTMAPQVQPLVLSSAKPPSRGSTQDWGQPGPLPARPQEVPSTPHHRTAGRQVNFTPQQTHNRELQYQQQQLMSPTMSGPRTRSRASSPSGQQNGPGSPIAFLQGHRGSQDLGSSYNGTFSPTSNSRMTDLAASEQVLAYNQIVNAELLRRQQQQQQLLSMSIAQHQAQSMLSITDQMRMSGTNMMFSIGPAGDHAASMAQSPIQDGDQFQLPAVTVSNGLNGYAADFQPATAYYESNIGSPTQTFSSPRQHYKMPVAQQPRFANQLLASSTPSPSRPVSRSNSVCSAASSRSHWGGTPGLDVPTTAQSTVASRGPSPAPSFDRCSEESGILMERVCALQDRLRDTEIESVRRRKEVEWAQWELHQVQAEAAQSGWEKDERIRELEWALHKQALRAQDDRDRSVLDRQPASEPEHSTRGSRGTTSKFRDLGKLDTKRLAPQASMPNSASPHSERPESFGGVPIVRNLPSYRNQAFPGKKGKRGYMKGPFHTQPDQPFRRGSAPNLYPYDDLHDLSSLSASPAPKRSQSVCEGEELEEEEVDIQLRMDPHKFKSLWSDPSRFTDMGLELESDFGTRSSDSGEYSADEGSWVGSIASNWTKGSKRAAETPAEVAGH